VIGAMTVAGLAPAGVLFGFGAFLISTGLFYGLPLPVQPMKAVSAVILTDGLRPGEVAAAGMMLGIVLLVLGITGWIGRLARAVPQSVSAGLQLGLGLLMGVLGIKLMLATPWIGFPALAALFLLSRIPRCPAAPIVLAASAIAGWATSGGTISVEMTFTPSVPQLVVPTWTEVWRSLEIAVLPQLSLTLTNAVIATASLSRELFPANGSVASERNLALSSGLANILLCPFGAMPMCHGAGGLQAQYRLLMGVLGIKLMLATPWIGFPALAALFLLSRIPRCPAAPIVLAASAIAGWATSGGTISVEMTFTQLVLPTWTEVWRSLEIQHSLPQSARRSTCLSKYHIRGSGDGRSKRAQTSATTTAPVRAAIAWLSAVLPAPLAPSRQMIATLFWGRPAPLCTMY
jgi:Molybdate transporter of MFS superfamily